MQNPLSTAEFFIHIRQPEKAKIVLDLLKPYANSIEEINQLGTLYAEIREFSDSLELAQKIYNLLDDTVDKFDARVNIIRALLNLNRPIDALEHILINEQQKPNDHPNQMDKAMVYFLLNKKAEGEQILRKILTQPRSKDIDFRVTFNLGTYDLTNGNFKTGMKHVLVDGKKLNIWETYNLSIPEWQGEVIPNKTILLCSEAGLGDEIIDVRFQKHIRDLGMNAVWYTNKKDLAQVFTRNGFDVITDLKQLQSDWLWTYSMIAPVLLDLDYKDLWYGPYLKPKREKEPLPGKFKVGIKCRGNPKYDQDLHRSLPEQQFLDCFPEDWTLYSFHIDDDIDDDRVISLKDKIKTWDDTLDYIDQMDLIVSSCTSLPHAASAMGKETIVVVPILNYYTWAYNNSTSCWYDKSTTIVRQQEYDNWNHPMQELKALLNAKNI